MCQNRAVGFNPLLAGPPTRRPVTESTLSQPPDRVSQLYSFSKRSSSSSREWYFVSGTYFM